MGKRRDSCSSVLARKFGPTKQEFLEAQKGLCPLCGDKIKSLKKANFDHVKSHVSGGKVCGNVLLTHEKCNCKKQADEPHEIYIDILRIVNARLGWNGSRYEKCKAYKRWLKLRQICYLHQDHGIELKIQSPCMWTVEGYTKSHESLIAHMLIFVPTAEIVRVDGDKIYILSLPIGQHRYA